MRIEVERFKKKARQALADERQRALLAKLPVLFKALREYSFSTMPDAAGALARGAAIRREAIRDLPHYLEEFESNVVRNGGKVLWAKDYHEATRLVVGLARERGVTTVTKGKSMLTEEMGLLSALREIGIEAYETDLGEFIAQQLGRAPFHIVGPAFNVPVEEIADLFVSVMGVERTTDLNSLTMQARAFLRDKFRRAEMGITGANMGVARTGQIVLVENEGNIRYSTGAPKTHVAVMGIEKVVPTIEDALFMLRLLTRSCTGQAISTYVNFISGPRKKDEVDGPDELFVVVVDAGRSKIYADPDFREVLQCIKCGACLNVCPVYNKVGGYPHGWVYSGPIGSILNPLFLGLDRAADLYHATTLCGACREACPAGIDHPRLMLRLRERRAAGDRRWGAKKPPLFERIAYTLWAWGIADTSRYRVAARLMGLILRPFARDGRIRWLPGKGRGWTRYRDFPFIARRTFRERWPDIEKGDER
jgi:L-lactate dehydrogenase complex protein LldF